MAAQSDPNAAMFDKLQLIDKNIRLLMHGLLDNLTFANGIHILGNNNDADALRFYNHAAMQQTAIEEQFRIERDCVRQLLVSMSHTLTSPP